MDKWDKDSGPGADLINVHVEGMRSIGSGTGRDATSTGYGSERGLGMNLQLVVPLELLLTPPLVLLPVQKERNMGSKESL